MRIKVDLILDLGENIRNIKSF